MINIHRRKSNRRLSLIISEGKGKLEFVHICKKRHVGWNIKF